MKIILLISFLFYVSCAQSQSVITPKEIKTDSIHYKMPVVELRNQSKTPILIVGSNDKMVSKINKRKEE